MVVSRSVKATTATYAQVIHFRHVSYEVARAPRPLTSSFHQMEARSCLSSIRYCKIWMTTKHCDVNRNLNTYLLYLHQNYHLYKSQKSLPEKASKKLLLHFINFVFLFAIFCTNYSVQGCVHYVNWLDFQLTELKKNLCTIYVIFTLCVGKQIINKTICLLSINNLCKT